MTEEATAPRRERETKWRKRRSRYRFLCFEKKFKWVRKRGWKLYCGYCIIEGKHNWLMSTRLAPLVTPFSECAKFKRCENRSFAPLSLRSSPFLNFAHSLNGVTRGASLVLINQLCFPSIITKSVKIRLQIKDTDLRKVLFDGERCALQSHMFRFRNVLYKLFSRRVFLFRDHHTSRAESKTQNRIIWDCLLALENDLCKIWCYQLLRRVRYCKLCSQRTRFFEVAEKRPE